MHESNFAKLFQTSSATVAAFNHAVWTPFFELVPLLQRAIGETHLFSDQAAGRDQLRQTSADEVAGRGYAVSLHSETASPLRRWLGATGNAFFGVPIPSRAVSAVDVGRLLQTSADEVAAHRCAVPGLPDLTSPLRRVVWATRNTSLTISRLRLGRASVKGERPTA